MAKIIPRTFRIMDTSAVTARTLQGMARFVQNLRRYLGYDVQYFAAIEPQRRLAPHIHIALRGTVARAEIRRVLAATYHQVWWPNVTEVKYQDGELLPQVVRQNAGRPPRRPETVAAEHARCFGNRPGPLRLGAHRAGRPGPPGPCAAAAARRRRPLAMASGTHRGPKSRQSTDRGSFGREESGMTALKKDTAGPALLTVEQAAQRLGTKPRFIRRLIDERRIEYHKVGRHVRISERALAEFIEAGRIAPVAYARRRVA